MYVSLLSPLGMGKVLHLNKFESSSPKDGFCKILLKLFSCRRRFQIFFSYCIFAIISLVGKRPRHFLLSFCHNFIFNKNLHCDYFKVVIMQIFIENKNMTERHFEFLLLVDALCQVWLKLVEIGPVVLEKCCRYFIIISPWKRAGPFI